MTSKIFRSIMLVACLVLVASLVLIMGVLYGYFSEERIDQLADETRLAAQGVERDGMGFFDGFVSRDSRITLIAPDGTVLYDSENDALNMENHANREEVIEAFESGEGDATRTSATLMSSQVYYAKRLSNGEVVRLATEQVSFLTMTLSIMQPIIVIMFAVAIGALLLAMRLSQKIVEPLNNVNFDEPLQNEGYDELEPLLRKIDVQQRKIRAQKLELSLRKREFAAVIDKMSEGLVLLSPKFNIISINRAAASLFEASDYEGKNFLSLCKLQNVHAVINEAAAGKRAEQIAELSDKEYKFSANPVASDDKVTGIVLLILDVTENMDAEKMRREFTANVSHELKTPLQTISGCAELLSGGIVKDADVPAFSKQIYSEAQRMIALVQDIISLSHLDEGAGDMEHESFDLYAVVSEAVNELMPMAQESSVSLDISGSSVQMVGIKRLVSVMAHNLCDNAIKYNRENGSVSVRVFRENGCAVLHVADTGIGIPKEDKDRVFERFYRVDKSRSKKVGGTGLGLSIVKHAVKLHNAEISIDSTVGKGTAITIKFKAQ